MANVEPIDNVLGELQGLLHWMRGAGSRIGYFASFYTRVTYAIRSAILNGLFSDGDAVARLDAALARRYLTAVQQHRAGDPELSPPWGIAMGAAGRAGLSVAQQVIVAVTAHINLDLGLAIWAGFGPDQLQRVERDYFKVNDVLASMVSEVERDFEKVSPLIGLLRRFGGALGTKVVDFRLDQARESTWRFVLALAAADEASRPSLIAERTAEVVTMCRQVLDDAIERRVFALIAVAEVKDVRQIIRTLDRGLPPNAGLPSGVLSAPRSVARLPLAVGASERQDQVDVDVRARDDVD